MTNAILLSVALMVPSITNHPFTTNKPFIIRVSKPQPNTQAHGQNTATTTWFSNFCNQVVVTDVCPAGIWWYQYNISVNTPKTNVGSFDGFAFQTLRQFPFTNSQWGTNRHVVVIPPEPILFLRISSTNN